MLKTCKLETLLVQEVTQHMPCCNFNCNLMPKSCVVSSVCRFVQVYQPLQLVVFSRQTSSPFIYCPSFPHPIPLNNTTKNSPSLICVFTLGFLLYVLVLEQLTHCITQLVTHTDVQQQSRRLLGTSCSGSNTIKGLDGICCLYRRILILCTCVSCNGIF